MAFLINQTPTSSAAALFLWKSTQLSSCAGLPSNGKITKSSNGSVFAALGDVILSAADLSTPGAWYVYQALPFIDQVDPNTELCFQHNGSGGLRAKISFRYGFTGGAPGLTRTPSAADEQYVLGGGTDASPTYTPFLQAPGFRMQGWFSESDETQYILFYPVGGGAATTLWFIDRPQPNPKGAGGNLLDPERIVFYASTGANCALAASIARDNTGPMSSFLYGKAGQLWGRCPAVMEWVYDSAGTPALTLPGGCATSPIYDEPTVPEYPFRYRRRAALAGVSLSGEVGDTNTVDDKGQSTYFRFAGQTQASPKLLDSVDPVTGLYCPNSALAVGDCLFPWNGIAISI